MTAEDLVRGVARVWSRTEEPEIVGTAVLVAPGLVITCAHVVARALGIEAESDAGPGLRVTLDLPAVAPGARFQATVVRWLPRRPAPGGAYDLCGLSIELDEGTAGLALPLPLVVDDAPWGKPCRVFGFPAGRPEGSYASGVLRDVLANGWILVKGGAEAREFTRPGYSGGPVITDDGMVGLLTEGDRDVRVREALLVPVSTILGAWPELQRAVSRSPFPGLAPFTAADAPFFHGRTRVAAELADTLATSPHLVVLAGPSGSGKSSLIAAAVLPRLAGNVTDPRTAYQSGATVDADHGTAWTPLTWRPGKAPFPELARALLLAQHPDAAPSTLSVESARLARDLDSGRVTLADVLLQDRDRRWVVAVDQAEELALEAEEPPEHASPSGRSFEALLEAHGDERLAGRLALLIAVRTDFLDGLLRHPALASRVSGEHVRYLGAVEDLRAVIEGPLSDTGVSRLEPGLTDRILADVGDVPNPLPLLQFTLAELWQDRRAGRLGHAAYDALGGVRRAIANHAEKVVETLDALELDAVRDVLLQLGRPGLGSSVSCRSARFDELGERGRTLVTRLADARLVITDRDAEGVERVEVAHEALFEHWPRLKQWWLESVEFRRWQESLRFAVRAWQEGGRDDGDLLHGVRLRTAESWLRQRPGAFAPHELSFVMHSAEQEQRQSDAARQSLRRELRLRRTVNMLLGVGMVTASVLAALAIWQNSSARRLRADAERLLHSTAEANAALATLTEELELSLGDSAAMVARQLGVQAVAMATDPLNFSGNMRLAALMAVHAVRLDPGPATYDYLLRVLQAHPTYRATFAAEGTAVAIAGDGRTIYMGDALGGIQRWDALTGARLGERSTAHRGTVTALATSPDGRRLLSGGADGRIYEWDALTLRRVARLPDTDGGPIAALAATADGRTWLSADLTGAVRAWDGAGRRQVAAVDRNRAVQVGETAARDVGGVAATVSGARAAASLAAAVRDPDGGIPIPDLSATVIDEAAAATHATWAAALAVHPQLPRVALPFQDVIAVLDARTFEVLNELPAPSGRLVDMAFTAGGEHLVIVTDTGSLTAIGDGGLGGQTGHWVLPLAEVRALAVGPDPHLVLVATADGVATWFDLDAGEVIGPRLRGHTQALTDAVVGQQVVITRSRDGRVIAWDREPRRPLGTSLGHVLDSIQFIRIAPDGSNAYLGSVDGAVARIDLRTLEVAATLEGAHVGQVFDAAPNGEVVATAGRDGLVKVWDALTFEPLATIWSHSDAASAVVWLPDRHQFMVGGNRGVIAAISWPDTASGQVVRQGSRGWSPGPRVEVSPDGETWAASFEMDLELWNSTELVSKVTKDGYVGWLVFDGPGQRLLGSSYPVTLWSVPDLAVVRSWSDAASGSLSPDGSLLAIGDYYGSLQLVDATTFEEIGQPLAGPSSYVHLSRFTPDSSQLVTAEETGEVRVWSTDPEHWIDLACELAWTDLRPEEVPGLLGDEPFEPVCVAADG